MRELQGRGVTTAFASKMTGFKQGFRTTFYSPYNGSWYFPADAVVRTP